MPLLSFGTLPPPYPSVYDPNMYLKFAQDDRKAGVDARSLVNAMSNVKRALHLRIDMLLYQLGLFKHYGGRGKNFPPKLELVEELGVLPTTLVRAINKERNELEHEYTIPASERVDEALDAIRLLYMASAKILETLVVEAVIGINDRMPAHAILRLEPEHGELRFFDIEPMPPGVITIGNDLEAVSGLTKIQTTKDLLKPIYTAADSPFKVVPLDGANKNEWLPIIEWIVSHSGADQLLPGGIGRWTKVGGSDDHYISTVVTIPFSMAKADGLTEATIKTLAQRDEREENETSKDSTTSEPS